MMIVIQFGAGAYRNEKHWRHYGESCQLLVLKRLQYSTVSFYYVNSPEFLDGSLNLSVGTPSFDGAGFCKLFFLMHAVLQLPLPGFF